MHAANKLEQYVAERTVDEIWIALPLRAERRVKELLQELGRYPVTIRFVPDIFGFGLINHAVSEIAGMPT